MMGGKRPGAGRPATGSAAVTAIRLASDMRARIDDWAAKQEDAPGRSEAIRRLVELGLTVKTKARPTGRLRAALVADLAAETIDSLPAGAAKQAGRRAKK